MFQYLCGHGSNSSYELLGKGMNFPLQRLDRGLLPLRWLICFWILHPAGQLHKYLHVSKLCSMDFAHVWCCGSVAHWQCFLHHVPPHLGGTTLGAGWPTGAFLPRLAPKETQMTATHATLASLVPKPQCGDGNSACLCRELPKDCCLVPRCRWFAVPW